MGKQKILIVDDSEMNRALLQDILEDRYDVVEAENGVQAVNILSKNDKDFWFVLLDIMMPEMNGFDVLNYINKHYWNDRVVVIMISSDDSPENIIRAYNLGAFDYISRPFDSVIVHKRVANTMLLYARQHDLEDAVKEQFYEQQKNSDLMVSILSYIVEFRNGESRLHIQHVKNITELILMQLNRLTDKYDLSKSDMDLICMASALHDIGKISIPENILNKPGRLTPEEFEMMKTHSEVGSNMLSALPAEQFNSPLVKTAYEICRWHHERYDGRGYPDGLKGEDIPISAQVVAMADVYDALTSERCYKKAFSHDTAISMITNGQCGAFNPLLLQCLTAASDKLKVLFANPDMVQDRRKGERTGSKTVSGNPARRSMKEMTYSPAGYMKLLYIDSLTNVFNRRYYEEQLPNFPNIDAIALVDVNRLEQINNQYGQYVGDTVLKCTAETLVSLVRKNDQVIRYGSDNFLIVFDSMEKDCFARKLAEIKNYFDELVVDDLLQLHISISIGGVQGVGKPKELFDAISHLLNHAKNPGEQLPIYYLDEMGDIGSKI